MYFFSKQFCTQYKGRGHWCGCGLTFLRLFLPSRFSPWFHSACSRQELTHNHHLCFCVGMEKSSQSHSFVAICLAYQCNMPKFNLGWWHMEVNALFIMIIATYCTSNTFPSLSPHTHGVFAIHQWCVSFQIPPHSAGEPTTAFWK